MTDNTIFLDGEKFSAYLEKKNLTTTEMSRRMGVNPSTLWRAVHEKRRVSDRFIAGLKNAGLNPMQYLLFAQDRVSAQAKSSDDTRPDSSLRR